MKIIPITELRQRAAEGIENAGATDEPIVVLQRSRKPSSLATREASSLAPSFVASQD